MVWSILSSVPSRPAFSLVMLDLSVAAVCLANCVSWPARALLWLDLATIHSPNAPLANLTSISDTCSAFIETHSIVKIINFNFPFFCIFWRCVTDWKPT